MLSEAFVKVLCCCTWAYKMRDECVVGRGELRLCDYGWHGGSAREGRSIMVSIQDSTGNSRAPEQPPLL